MLGLQGGVKVIDKKPVPAYRIVYKGISLFTKEQLAQESEFMPEKTIPTFLKELANVLNKAQLPFATWLQTNEETFIQLIQQYANIIID
jgi:ferredoxin-nitrite reductase